VQRQFVLEELATLVVVLARLLEEAELIQILDRSHRLLVGAVILLQVQLPVHLLVEVVITKLAVIVHLLEAVNPTLWDVLIHTLELSLEVVITA